MTQHLSRRRFGAGVAGALLIVAGCTDPEPAPEDEDPPDDGEEGDLDNADEPADEPTDDTGV